MMKKRQIPKKKVFESFLIALMSKQTFFRELGSLRYFRYLHAHSFASNAVIRFFFVFVVSPYDDSAPIYIISGRIIKHKKFIVKRMSFLSTRTSLSNELRNNKK